MDTRITRDRAQLAIATTPAIEVPRGRVRGLAAHDLPSTRWASEPEFGVPLLDPELQAGALDMPFARWGRERRKARMSGTWHFYTDDSRFSALWCRPLALINSGCVATVEPNFSVAPDAPRAMALWQTYRKRHLARLWQEYGVRVLADLNVAAEHAGLNMLGIPPGWRSYCTRGYNDHAADLDRQYALATDRAGGGRVLFVVYGGGRVVRELAAARGWVHHPEEQDEVRHG